MLGGTQIEVLEYIRLKVPGTKFAISLGGRKMCRRITQNSNSTFHPHTCMARKGCGKCGELVPTAVTLKIHSIIF